MRTIRNLAFVCLIGVGAATASAQAEGWVRYEEAAGCGVAYYSDCYPSTPGAAEWCEEVICAGLAGECDGACGSVFGDPACDNHTISVQWEPTPGGAVGACGDDYQCVCSCSCISWAK